MSDTIQISVEPISVTAAIAAVSDARAGAIDVFLGTTRAETNADGRELIALDYEAYVEMAEKRLRELAAEARAKWPIVRLVVLHRVGRVPLAEPSVLIAVATPHRADAFAACRWLIDAVKADVPIWKKEIWASGEETWVHG